MKRKNLLLSLILLAPFCCFAQDAVGAMGPAGLIAFTDQPGPAGTTSIVQHIPTCTETWIAFLPGIFFFIVLLLTTLKLRNSRVKISDILAEKDKNGATVANTAATADTPADPQATPLPPVQSVSRFIIFLTGLVTLIIAICLTIFFMYTYFSSGKPVDLANLNTVILGLGIGVIPYGANKVSSALKP